MNLTFVIGPPRSGTTLMLEALGLHPSVLALGEELHRFHHDLGRLTHRHDEDDHFRFTARDALPELAAEYRAVLDAAVRSSGRPKVVVKISTLSLQIDYLLALFPEARFIQCVRDGRDTVCSMEDLRLALERDQGHPRLLGPAPDPLASWAAETFAHPHVRAGCAWFYHVTRSYLDLRFAGADRFMRLRYEDLLDAPRDILSRVMSFIGLELDPAQQPALDATTDTPSSERTLGFSTSQASGARLARYMRDLSPSVRTVLAPLLAQPMEILGYVTDPLPTGAELASACEEVGVDTSLWKTRVAAENAWFSTQLATFDSSKMLREPDPPQPGSRPLLIDGATFGCHSDMRDGHATVAHAWVRKQNRTYAFADEHGLWPSIAARLDGTLTLSELVPPKLIENASRICAYLHGLGLVGYL